MARPDADRILAEAGWVRALARSLLRSEDEASDLAQEALTEALAADLPDSKPGLRAWLRTVLRRKAGRRYEARSLDAHALQALARERGSAEARAEQTLELHEELVQALRALAPGDRDLLVRRHLEGASAQSLARELGLPPATLRKRLARARQRLREVLASSERGAEGWRQGLIVLALPAGSLPPGADGAAPVVPASIPAAATPAAALFVMGKSKVLLFSLVSIALLAGAWIVSARRPVSADAEGDSDEGQQTLALAPERGAEDLALIADGERLALASEDAGAEQPVGEPGGSAVLRVLGEGSRPLESARVFLAPEGGDLIKAASSGDGTLELPVVPGLRAFVEHEDHCTVLADLGAVDPGSIHTVRMRARPVLRVRVTVDGSPPGEELVLSYFGERAGRSLGDRDRGLLGRLSRAGFESSLDQVVCGPDGSGVASIPYPMERVSLRRPEGFLIAAVNGKQQPDQDRGMRLATDGSEHTIELLRMPCLLGRLVWEDDGSPVQGRVEFGRVDERGYGLDGSTSTPSMADGRFRIGVDEILTSMDPDEKSSEGPRATIGRRAHAIRLEASHPEAARYMRHEFIVAGATFPLDVGDIAVKRLPVLEVTVLGRSDSGWRPLVAGVRSAMDGVTTGRDGRASLRVWDNDHLDVLAAGHEFVRVPVTAAAHPDGLEIRLETAPDLLVRMPPKLASQAPEARPRVQIRFSKSPFGSWQASAGDQPEFNNSIYTLTQGVWRSGPSAVQSDSVEYYVPDSGVVTISGLSRGVDFELLLVDVFGGEFCSRRVVFDGAQELADWPDALDPAWLSAEVVDGSGQPAPSGRFGLKGAMGWGAYLPFDRGSLRLGPLAPRPVVLTVLPDGGADSAKRELLLTAGENRLQVVLGEETPR